MLYVHSTRQYEKLGRQEAKKALTIIMAIYAKHTACTTIASAAAAAAAPQLPPWLDGHLPCRLVLVCLIFAAKTESVSTKFHNGERKNKTKVVPIGAISSLLSRAPSMLNVELYYLSRPVSLWSLKSDEL